MRDIIIVYLVPVRGFACRKPYGVFDSSVYLLFTLSKLWTSAKFFERLDFFLSEKNWTLYQLCSDVDITVDAIYKMRRRNTLPSLQSVCIICDALGLSLAEFFSVEILSPDCKAIMDSFETISNQSLSALAILVQHLK